MPAALPGQAPTRFGRQRNRTDDIVAGRSAEDLAPFRSLEYGLHDATQGHTADSQLSRPHRPVYPSARFRPPAPVGAWSLNSSDSPEIPASP